MAAPQVGTVQDGYRFTGGNPASPSSWQRVAPAPPQKGAVVGGYRFTGGDPASPSSWEQAEDTSLLGLAKESALTAVEPLSRLTRGALGGLESITNVFGAGNAASEFLQGAQEGITEHLITNRSRRLEQERATRNQGKGFLDTLKSLPGELLEDPGMLADIAGAAVPAVAAGVLTAPEGGVGALPVIAGGVTGVAMGAGAVKGGIYDATKTEFMRAGVSKEDAERAADEAQSYTGKNIDMITLGGLLGGLASETGIEPALTRTIAGRVLGRAIGREATEGTLREGLEGAAEQAAAQQAGQQAAERGLIRSTVSEAVPQALMGGQQQLAQNLALQREGFDRDTWQGVGGAAAEQGILGGILGAGMRGAMKLGARGEELPPPTAGERFAPEATETRENIMERLQKAAGEELPAQARAAVKSIERSVSDAVTTGTPEAIAKSTAYLDEVSGKRDAGIYHDVVADALERPVLDENGMPALDSDKKPIYEGVLAEARRILDEHVQQEAQAVKEAEPVKAAPEMTPESYVDRYMAGEGRGASPADLEMQQYAANFPKDIEAEFARRNAPEAEPVKAAEEIPPVEKAAPEAEPVEEPEIDYDNHPLMQEHEAKYDSYVEGIDEFTHVNSVRKRARDLIKDGVLDESALDDINEAIHDEESGYKLDAGIGALHEAIENARDEARYDVEYEIEQEAQEKAEAPAQPEVPKAPPAAEEPVAPAAPEAPKAPPTAAPEPEIKPAAEEPPAPPAPPEEGLPPPTAEKTPAKMELLPNWFINFMDKFGQSEKLNNYAKSVLGYGDQLPEQLDTALNLRLLQTKTSGQEKLLRRNFFTPVEDLIAKSGQPQEKVDMLLWANEAIQRNPEIAQRNENFPEGGAGITTAQAREIRQNFKDDGSLPALTKIANEIYKLRDHTLNTLHKAGMISDEDFTRYQSNPFYVPLKGFAAEGDLMTSGKIEDEPHSDAKFADAQRMMAAASPTGRVNEFQKAMGRGSMPFSPMYNLFQDAEQAVRRVAKMEAAQPLLRAFNASPGDFEGMMHVYTDKNPKKVQVSRTTLGGTYEPVRSMADQYRDKPGQYLMVKDKGIPHYIEFTDSDEGQALKRMFANMNPEQMGTLTRALSKTNGFMKGLLTFKNPLYLTTVAPIRDIHDAIATAIMHQNTKGSPVWGLREKNPQLFIKNFAGRVAMHIANPTTWKATGQFLGSSKVMPGEMGRLMEDFIREGGTPLHARFSDAQSKATEGLETIRRKQGNGTLTPRSLAKSLNHWVDNLADFVDIVPRFATYRAAIEMGVSPSRAADLALDSSLNLTRKGQMARGMDLIVPFFGANVEGSRKIVRMMRSPRAAIKIVGAMVAYGVAESMYNAMMSGDTNNDGEPDYMDLDRGAGMRMSRAVLFYGHGPDDYVKIPIGQMLGYFKFVGNKMGDMMVGNSTPAESSLKMMDAGKELMGGLANLMLPMRIPGGDVSSAMTGLSPLIAKPFVENAFNQNFWGSPIYEASFPGGAPRSELGRSTTADTWKYIARAVNSMTGGSAAVSGTLDYNPEAYRHIVESFLGGPYQIGKQLAGIPEAEGAADIPGIKSFVGTGAKYAPQSKYFDNSSKIRQIMGQAAHLDPDELADQIHKYGIDTDPIVVRTYKAVESGLEHINKERKAVMEQMNEGNYSAKDKQTVEDYYLAQKNQYYNVFNNVYHDARVRR